MTEITYPREWFRADEWGDRPYIVVFEGETDTTLWSSRGLWVPKTSSLGTWHPTIEEAQADIGARKAARLARERDRLVREAAPTMLKAIMEAVDAMRAYLPPDGIDGAEFISRVIGALDNPDIYPIVALADEWAKGESK